MERSKSLNFISRNNPLHQSNELFDRQPDLPSPTSKGKSHGEGSSDDATKKITHRNVERQRRQEMTTRYELLRSLIPVEYLKGKRSISDHMHEAANYIKHLEKNIKEMKEQRDKLAKLLNSISPDVVSKRSCSSDFVVVRPCMAGVEMIISTSLRNGVGPLSRMIGVLVEGGLDVVTCISTQSNEMLIHTVQSEVTNQATVDIPGLQQKLMFVVESASRFS